MSGGKDRYRIVSFGFAFGDRVSVTDLGAPASLIRRLPAIGQEHTYLSQKSSTELMAAAATEALARAGVDPSEVSLVITAPSLLTGHGLEIPAVALRASLGLAAAECLNLGQGCAGALRAHQLAARHLAVEPDAGPVLVVTGCRASTLTRHLTHGAFFWGDGAAATVVSSAPRPGLAIGPYAESSADAFHDAMRIPFGDAGMPDGGWQESDFLLTVEFASGEDQIAYIEAEQARFDAVVDSLCRRSTITEGDIAALFLPSVGRNRMHHLLGSHPRLANCLKTNFAQGHVGGADPAIFLYDYLASHPRPSGALLLMTPAYTAQWAGLALHWVE